MNNNFAPTKMVSKLANEEVKLGAHYHIKQAQDVTSIIARAEAFNIGIEGLAMATQEGTAIRVIEIKGQLEGLTMDQKVRELENLRCFFVKQLCRAQHSRLKAAIIDSRNLLAAIRTIETEIAFG